MITFSSVYRGCLMTDFSQFKYQDNLTRKNKAMRLLWNFVWLFFFRPTPRGFFNSWRIFLLKLFGAKIGKGSKVAPSCIVWAPWNLSMGDFSVLGDKVDCYSMDRIVLGSKVAVSQYSYLCTGSHDITSYRRQLITKPITIADHAWVCAGAFVGPGVTIADGAVVAARAVVVKDVEKMDVVAGNPAVKVKKRAVEEEDEY